MAEWSGTVGHVGILDLTWAKSPEDLARVTSIEDVGIVQVSKELYGYVISIPQQSVGMVQVVASGPHQSVTGSLRMTGDFLAHGNPETILDVTGCLLVLPPVEEIGFKQIVVNGVLALPRGSEGILSAKLGDVTGAVTFYPADQGTPRFITDNESIGREFLELLPEPTPFVVMGNLTVENDVTADLMRSKVSEIILYGNLRVPRPLYPLVQFLTKEKSGNINAVGSPSASPDAPAEQE